MKNNSVEVGKYLGYSYILRKDLIFWHGKFGKDKFIMSDFNKSFTKEKARKKLFTTITNYHFTNLKGKNYERFKT